MIEVADANAVYYYHFDALGSVVALSDAAGDTVQTYEYSVYGEVAVEDANHPNPYMFAGVRYDIEIGLYYNRARYYNPFTGRFLQTDPIGYGAGMNLYAYCGNNPLGFSDPSGLYRTKTVPIPIESIIDPDKFTDWSPYASGEQIDAWLRDVGFYKLYPDWSLDSVEVSGESVILTLYCDDEDHKGEPNFSVSWLDVKEAGSVVDTVPVALLDGVGLLNEWTLNRIIKPAIQRVNAWDRESSWAEILDLLMTKCDTAFRYFTIEKWRYKGNVFDNDDINYILEGHAMKHLNIPSYAAARLLVWLHKHFNTTSKQVTPGVVFWFDKGWKEYSARSSW
jgi:RHS repeat-associated protein